MMNTEPMSGRCERCGKKLAEAEEKSPSRLKWVFVLVVGLGRVVAWVWRLVTFSPLDH